MKDLMKKLSVLFVAVLMLVTSGTTHVHAEIDRGKNKDTLVISGLDEGDKVELYQIYNATYSTDGKTVESYQFVNADIVDGGKEVVIVPEQLYEAADAEVVAGTKQVGDVKVAEVKVKIADLPTDSDGKIKVTDTDGVTIGSDTYKTGDENVDLTAAKALNGKYPFTVTGTGTNVGPTESQILAISAAIAAHTLSVDPVTIYTEQGNTTATATELIAGDDGKVQVEAYAKAVANAATDDLRKAIYDATGIYIGRITPAPGKDTIYNPIVVSAGYKTQNNESVFEATDPLNVSTAKYTYEVSKGTAKKSTPTVDKTVTGGFLETGNKPIVAMDLDGHPYGYTYTSGQLLPDDALTYILSGKTQTDVDNALKIADADERATALNACTTKNVEEAATANAQNNIRSGALGSLFSYKITPTIPDYPENAVNKTLWFADRMGKGLDYVEGSLVVNLGSEIKLTPVAYDAATHAELLPNGVTPDWVYLHDSKVVAYAKEADNGFTINFIYDNIPAAVAKSGSTRTGLSLEYQAVLNDEAFVGLPGNPNVATMIYSNNPDKGSTHEDLTKPSGEGNREVEDEEIVYTYEIKFNKVGENNQALDGAIFGLYAKAAITDSDGNQLYAAGDLVCTIETANGGQGATVLAAPGSYYLQEIQAPPTYQLNSNPYDVTVSWGTATKKYSKTRESWEYTTTKPTQTTPYDYTKQVGWLVGPTPTSTSVTNGTSGEFYQLGDFPLASWTYNATNHTLKNETTQQVINNVWEAYIDPASHVKMSTLSEETVTRTDKTGLGWVEYEPAIPNTKTPSLPATGGIGTYLFTVAGVAILALGAFMLIFRRREDSQH